MDLKQLCRRIRFALKLSKKAGISMEAAQACINTCHFQSPPSFSQHNIIRNEYDLMIVLPVYNVELYLQACLDSIFTQKTQYRFCVVAVNDGSTDGSGEILEQYSGYENLTIIHQENRGYSGARNRALENINGRYVMFVDSDDLLAEGAVEALLNIAIQKDADMVAGGYVRFSEKEILEQVYYDNGIQKVASDKISGYTCMKVIRAKLLKNFCFPEGFLFEDTVLPQLVFPLCQNVFTTDKIVYEYRAHGNSISASHHKQARCVDTYWITKYCLEEAARRGYMLNESQYKKYLQQCWVNFLRTRYLPEEIQESIFVLTRELLTQHFGSQQVPLERKYQMLHRAFSANSYEAYLYILRRWDVL